MFKFQLRENNMAKCKACKNKIKKGDPCVWSYDTYLFHPYRYYMCNNCAYEIITNRLEYETGNARKRWEQVLNKLSAPSLRTLIDGGVIDVIHRR